MLAIYSLGLGIPFLAIGAALDTLTPRHQAHVPLLHHSLHSRWFFTHNLWHTYAAKHDQYLAQRMAELGHLGILR